MEKFILDLIKNGENNKVEFKLAKDNIPKNLMETVCAFSNSWGGYIILGVDDNKKIIGVPKENIPKLKKDFTTLCNNIEVIKPPLDIHLKDIKIKDKYIMYAYIPISHYVHTTRNKIFKRNFEGDFDITNQYWKIKYLYKIKNEENYEKTPLKWASMEDLRPELINNARNRAVIFNANHPWKDMSNEELLRSAKLIEYSEEYKSDCLNIACILLFGSDLAIGRASVQ